MLRKVGPVALMLLMAVGCAPGEDDGGAAADSNVTTARAGRPANAPRCLAIGTGTGLPDSTRFTVVAGAGHHETLKIKDLELLYDEGKNKIELTVKRGGKTLFQGVAPIPDAGTTGRVELVVPFDGDAALDIQCEPKTPGAPPRRAPARDNDDEKDSRKSTAMCVALGSGTGLPDDGQRFTLLEGGGHHEALTFRNFELEFEIGKNKLPLTIKRDGKVLFQAVGLVPALGTAEHIEVMVPLDGDAALDVTCEAG